jgi:hypothetical protein
MKYINISIIILVVGIFASCSARRYETNTYYQICDDYNEGKLMLTCDTRVHSADSLHIGSQIVKECGNPDTIKYRFNFSGDFRHIGDTITLNNFSIIDKYGDTMQTNTIVKFINFDNISTTTYKLPYTFIIDENYLNEYDNFFIEIFFHITDYDKKPKSIFVSYDLKVNDFVLERENIKYTEVGNWGRCWNLLPLFEPIIIPILDLFI